MNRWSILAYWRTTTQERVDLEFDAIIAATYSDVEEAHLLALSAQAGAFGF
jgi:hypothetical protein